MEQQRGTPSPVPNVLASRYASAAMVEVWRPEGRIRLERELWVAVLRAQAELGVPVPEGAIEAYEAVVDDVDLASIAARERVLRHDVKARIEEFCALAGHEVIHRGMTSRDVTENVEQLQIRRALELVRDRLVAALVLIAERAVEHRDTVVVGRSHNMPAQPTTFGKRLTNVGQELMSAYERIESLLERQPLRGLKGPVGTQADLLTLLGDAEKVEALEAAVAEHLGFEGASTPSARSTRARSTSRSSDRSCRPRAHPRRSRTRCGSWPATSSSPRASPPGRSARPRCPTR